MSRPNSSEVFPISFLSTTSYPIRMANLSITPLFSSETYSKRHRRKGDSGVDVTGASNCNLVEGAKTFIPGSCKRQSPGSEGHWGLHVFLADIA